jgi:hypothetical protein
MLFAAVSWPARNITNELPIISLCVRPAPGCPWFGVPGIMPECLIIAPIKSNPFSSSDFEALLLLNLRSYISSMYLPHSKYDVLAVRNILKGAYSGKVLGIFLIVVQRSDLLKSQAGKIRTRRIRCSNVSKLDV